MATTAVSALIIMIVEKDQGRKRAHHSPGLTKSFQITHLIHIITSVETIFELGHTAKSSVLRSSDGFTTLINNFLPKVQFNFRPNLK